MLQRRRGHRVGLIVIGFLAGIGAVITPTSSVSAAASASPICSGVAPQFATASGPRIQHITIAGTPVAVLLPPDYRRSHRRYPVLYLLHGGTAGIDSFLVTSDLVARTGALPDSEQFIVVTPYGGLTGFYVDWADGSHDYETRIIDQVIPAVDAGYRTVATRRGRAVAGVSMGAWGAVFYAVRHPGMFGAVGSLSGGLDDQNPGETAVLLLATQTQRQCGDGVRASQVDPFGMFGNPVTDFRRWYAANPVLHADHLRGMDVYLTAGSGVPCDATDVSALTSSPTAAAVEAIVGETTAEMNLALDAAGIAHTYLPRACGIHTDRYFDPELDAYLAHIVARWYP